MDIRTRVVHGGDHPRDVNGAVSVPIYASATFSHPGVGETTGFDYSRIENPTRNHLERLIAAPSNVPISPAKNAAEAPIRTTTDAPMGARPVSARARAEARSRVPSGRKWHRIGARTARVTASSSARTTATATSHAAMTGLPAIPMISMK